MKRFKVILTVALTLLLSVSVAMAVTMSVSELKELVSVGDEPTLGAFPGPDIYQNVNIYGTLTTDGGKYLATSSLGSAHTLSIKDMRENAFISFTSNTGNFTYTLPATSTMMELLPEIGSTRTWLFHNATTTAATTLTLAAGGGMDLVAVTANDDIIDGGEYSRLTCTQIPFLAANNENIMCIVDELLNAD